VYTITKKDDVKLFYTNTKNNGHFNLPKVIWSNGLGTYPIIDKEGYYALTQFSYGIVDDIENLEKIEKCLKSKRFQKDINLNTKFISTEGNPLAYPKIIATFRKDFWKEYAAAAGVY
jgi:hypothetical protein